MLLLLLILLVFRSSSLAQHLLDTAAPWGWLQAVVRGAARLRSGHPAARRDPGSYVGLPCQDSRRVCQVRNAVRPTRTVRSPAVFVGSSGVANNHQEILMLIVVYLPVIL